MSGTVLQILDRTSYDFSGLDTGKSMLVYAAQNVDVSQWREGTLMVRVHDRSVAHASSKVSVSIVSVLPTPTVVATFDITTNTNQQQLHRVAFAANFGAMVSLVIQGDQGGDAAQHVKATISVVLSLKS